MAIRTSLAIAGSVAIAAAMTAAVLTAADQGRGRAAVAQGPLARKASCTSLAMLTFEGNTTIASATDVVAGPLAIPGDRTLNGLPAFCRVIGVSKPSAES